MNISKASLPGLRLHQQLHQFTSTTASSANIRLPRQDQHVVCSIRLLSTAYLHIQPVLSSESIRLTTLPSSRHLHTYSSDTTHTYPYTSPSQSASTCSLFTAQTSQLRPLIQASKLGGVPCTSRSSRSLSPLLHYSPRTPYSPSNKIHSRLFKPCSSIRSFSSSSILTTMSSLSQPQTPAALNSPLREHRHRPVERLTEKLEAPSLDDRSYRVILLPNQLEVLLVHDAETDKASAAMDVNVGNFSDEKDMPGMAHAVCKSPQPCVFSGHVWDAQCFLYFVLDFEALISSGLRNTS